MSPIVSHLLMFLLGGLVASTLIGTIAERRIKKLTSKDSE